MNDRSFLNDRSKFEQLLSEHGSVRAVSRETGVPRSTVQDAATRLQASSFTSCEQCAPSHITLEKQRIELSRLRALNKKLALVSDKRQEALSFLQATDCSILDPEPHIASTGKTALISSWNDLHYGSNTDADSINGLYSYSPEIARERMAHIVDHVTEQINTHDIEDVVIVLNGDNANGMTGLHPDESTDTERIAVQIRDAAGLFASKLWDLNERHPNVSFRVIGTRGNHTRSTLKSPTSATDFGLSWEMLMFELVKAHGPDAFDYHHEMSYRTYFEAGGVWCVAAHGHMLSGGGITHVPEAGVKKFCEDADWALREMNGNKLGLALLAHFHRLYQCEWRHVTAFIAPSPKGPDSFGRDKIHDLTWPGYLSIRCRNGHISGTDILRFR
jgi:hypothetical protein